MNIVKILELKYPTSRNLIDWAVSDSGDGVHYISLWNLSDPKPTDMQLQQWEVELDLQLRQKEITNNRAYPSWQQQMDMLYHDKLNNTTVWQDTITAIKAANPKPTA